MGSGASECAIDKAIDKATLEMNECASKASSAGHAMRERCVRANGPVF